MIGDPNAVACEGDACEIPTASTRRQSINNQSINRIQDPRMTDDTLDLPIDAIDAQDRYAIEDVIIAYGTAIDTRDWDLFQSIFTEDAKVDYGFGSWNTGEEFRQFMQATHDPAGNTLHRMTNIVVTRTGTGISARTYGDSIVLVPDNRTGDHGAAYYDDELVLMDGRWRIARRRCTLVLFEKITDNVAASM
jgi:hypothetical protein